MHLVACDSLKHLEPVALQRARGIAKLSTKQVLGRTRLDTLFQEGCAKIRLPNTHSPSLEAVLINTAGGITGGDRLDWSAEIGDGGHAVLTTQACERSYRSTGAFAHVRTSITIGAGGHLDWLPQETILFGGSKLRRSFEVDLASNATLTAIEAVLLGREAMGEDARDAMLHDRWRIRRNGRLVHAEATQLSASAHERDGISLLDGCLAFATIVHLAADPDRAIQIGDALRASLPPARIGVSVNGERLVIRAMSETGLALRRLIVPVLNQLSTGGSLPRLWHL